MNALAPGRAQHQQPTPVPVRPSLVAGCAIVDQTSHQTVFHIPDVERRSEVALGFLRTGHHIVNPFARYDDPRLIIRTPSSPTIRKRFGGLSGRAQVRPTVRRLLLQTWRKLRFRYP